MRKHRPPTTSKRVIFHWTTRTFYSHAKLMVDTVATVCHVRDGRTPYIHRTARACRRYQRLNKIFSFSSCVPRQRRGANRKYTAMCPAAPGHRRRMYYSCWSRSISHGMRGIKMKMLNINDDCVLTDGTVPRAGTLVAENDLLLFGLGVHVRVLVRVCVCARRSGGGNDASPMRFIKINCP